MVLKYRVLKQIISSVSSVTIVANSNEYLEMEFEFSPEWATATGKVATFKKVGETDPLPSFVINPENKITAEQHLSFTEGEWEFDVEGTNSGGLRITTTPITLTVYNSGNSIGGVDVPLTIGEQILSIAQEAKTIADDASANVSSVEPIMVATEEARDIAITAKDDAVTAKTASETAQGFAEAAQSGAVNAKVDAINAKDEAVIQANIAIGKAAEASDSLIDTVAAKEIAVSSALEAQSYAKFGTFSLVGNMLVATIEAASDITDIKINEEGELVITIGD